MNSLTCANFYLKSLTCDFGLLVSAHTPGKVGPHKVSCSSQTVEWLVFTIIYNCVHPATLAPNLRQKIGLTFTRMTDYTYMGVVAPEWEALERDFPQWFDQTTPPHWTLQDIKNDINSRRAKEAARDAQGYSIHQPINYNVFHVFRIADFFPPVRGCYIHH